MSALKEIFDPAKLDDHQLGCLEFVLNSPAYLDVFEPYLRGMRDNLNMRILDRSSERKSDMSDDFLAGGVVAIDGLLNLFKKIIEETQMQRIDDAMQRLTPAQVYDRDRAKGRHAPVLGANEPIDGPAPYDPATDY